MYPIKITRAEAFCLACGCFTNIRLGCALLGFFVFLLVGLPIMDSLWLSLAVAATLGMPLGVAVLVPTVWYGAFYLLRSTYSHDVARRARQWAGSATPGDKFDIAPILVQSATDLMQEVRQQPHGSKEVRHG